MAHASWPKWVASYLESNEWVIHDSCGL